MNIELSFPTLVAVIDPDRYPGVASPGTAYYTEWLSLADFERVMCVVQSSTALGPGSIFANLELALNSAGSGAVTLSGSSITGLVQASGSNKQVVINLLTARAESLPYTHYRLKVSRVLSPGGEGMSASVYGIGPRYTPAIPVATLEETVSV